MAHRLDAARGRRCRNDPHRGRPCREQRRSVDGCASRLSGSSNPDAHREPISHPHGEPVSYRDSDQHSKSDDDADSDSDVDAAATSGLSGWHESAA